MYFQKLYKNGNSVAVTIPKQILRNLDLRDGTQVIVEERGREMVLKSAKKVKAPEVDAKFMKMVDEFMREHEDVLAQLAK